MSEQKPISEPTNRDYGSTAVPPSVSFVDFSPTELYNLTETIADNVNAINAGLKELEKNMKMIGGPKDSLKLREKIHDLQQTVNGTVSATSRDIQRLGVVVRRGDKPQKLQVERLTQAFKEALARYSTVQKNLTEKMLAHMPRRTAAKDKQQLLEEQAIADDEEAQLLAQEQAQARLVQFETSMMLEREAYINKIESDVLDVNQIMQELASMVHEQGQTVDTVESHIEDASSRVETGVDRLAKAAEYQRSYRKKMIIITLIISVIAAVIIIWIVKSLS